MVDAQLTLLTRLIIGRVVVGCPHRIVIVNSIPALTVRSSISRFNLNSNIPNQDLVRLPVGKSENGRVGASSLGSEGDPNPIGGRCVGEGYIIVCPASPDVIGPRRRFSRDVVTDCFRDFGPCVDFGRSTITPKSEGENQ